MLFAEMKVGVPYIVTRESDDGSLGNLQAEGWLDPEDLAHWFDPSRIMD